MNREISPEVSSEIGPQLTHEQEREWAEVPPPTQLDRGGEYGLGDEENKSAGHEWEPEPVTGKEPETERERELEKDKEKDQGMEMGL